MLSLLPEEVLLIITGFMDDFQKLQFSLTSKYLYNLVFDESLQLSVNEYMSYMRSVREKAHLCIRRINTDGVVYGECEQCFRKNLLYTYNDGYHERTICIEKCRTYDAYCIYCYNLLRPFNINNHGCPICRQRLVYTYSQEHFYPEPSRFNQYLIRI